MMQQISLSLSMFFTEFNKSIPQKAVKMNTPKQNEIGVYRKDVEEAGKIYFMLA